MSKKAKKTALLVAELEMIADTLGSKYCADILRDAAARLHDLESIAGFYHKEAESRVKRCERKVKRRDKITLS